MGRRPEDRTARRHAGATGAEEALSRKLKGSARRTSLPGAPDGQYLDVEFETSFAKKKHAVETVTPMREADGSWKVSGYYVR